MNVPTYTVFYSIINSHKYRIMVVFVAYLLSSRMVVDFRHGAEGGTEFVHGWGGGVDLPRQ